MTAERAAWFGGLAECARHLDPASSACNSSPRRLDQALACVPGGRPARPDDGPGHSVAAIAIDPGVVWLAPRSLRAHSATLRILTVSGACSMI